MSVTKQKDGRWLVSCRPSGVAGPQIRRKCKTKTLGLEVERKIMSSTVATMDNSYLSECVQKWFDYWGVNLKDGQRRLNKLNMIVEAIGDFRLHRFNPSYFLDFRKERLAAGISPNTCNHDLVYFKTVFNKLKKASLVSKNPLSQIGPLKFDDVELLYLTSCQIKRLLVACKLSMNESLYSVVLLCLATGARWSEAERITFTYLFNNTVTYTKTKNGKSRTVPISPELFDFLAARPRYSYRLFENCLSAFRGAVDRARIKLPKGQMSHVLRHTFASHFVMNGGDILTLQRILGHSDIKVTMRYAHLSADHLQDAVKYNPLSAFS